LSIILTGTESVTLTSDSDVELTINVEYTDTKNGVSTDHQHDGSTRDSVEIVGPPPQQHARTVTRISVTNQQRAGQSAVVITAAGSTVFTGTLQAGDSVDFDGATFTHVQTGGDGHSSSGNGGSSSDPSTYPRGVYDNPTNSVVPSGVVTDLSWGFGYGDEVLDLTDPQNPVVIVAGIYAVTAWPELVSGGAGMATITSEFDMGIDANNDYPYLGSGPAFDDSLLVYSPLTYYCRAGSTMRFRLQQNSGSDRQYKFSAVVQRLTPDPT
jgi:hypothetical protein